MNNMDLKAEGVIFNIQKFSVHDGPGVRTIVFLKGCPLRCPWCSNPESQKKKPELSFNPQKCLGIEKCGLCTQICPEGKRFIDGRGYEPSVCIQCHQCASVCPTEARKVFGRLMTVEEILLKVEQDNTFYSRSEGGLTLSGGEPLAQPKFSRSLLRAAKSRWIDTAMETSGFSSWPEFEECCRHLDYLIFDIKTMDESKHRAVIKTSNMPILDNFVKMRENFPRLPVRVRTPVIPGFNDTENDIKAIFEFLQNYNGVEYELLPYHIMGKGKYEHLGLDFPMGDAQLNEGDVDGLRNLIPENMLVAEN